jgi:hypothetical protein
VVIRIEAPDALLCRRAKTPEPRKLCITFLSPFVISGGSPQAAAPVMARAMSGRE